MINIKRILTGIIILSALFLAPKAYAESSSVSIDTKYTVDETCGDTKAYFTGTASFNDSQILVAYVDGNYDSETTDQGEFNFEKEVSVGSHELDMYVMDKECKDIKECEALASDGITFEIDKCEDNQIPAKVERKTFNEDKKCHSLKPTLPTWSTMTNGVLNWSATGGDRVELKFGYNPETLPYTVILTNDGHQSVGVGTDIGWWGGYWKLRTINDCKKGDWSELYFSKTF